MTVLTRPDSITDELLDRITARVVSTGGGVWKLTEVYTGEVITTLPQSSPADIETAFARAREAQRTWSQWPISKRLKVFKKFHQLLLEHNTTIVDLIQAESGKARRMAFDETCDPAMVTSHYLKRAAKLLAPVTRGGPVPIVSTSTEVRQPKGVVAIIAPWNFPFATGLSDAIPALMAGNGVVLKPDNKTALSPLYGISLLYEAGLPEGLFQVVCGEGPDVGPTLIDNANYVMFTGSTATGRVIGERAGAQPDRLLPRARRQEPDDRAARRQPRRDGDRRAVRRLRQHRPDLHAHRADVHPRLDLRRVQEALRRGDQGAEGRRVVRLRAGGRLAGLGRPEGPGRLPRRRCRREGRHRADRRTRAPRHRAGILRADHPRGRHPGHARRLVRDLRTGRGAAPLPHGRRGGRAGQRHRVRPQRQRLGRRPEQGDRGRQPHRGGQRQRQRHPRDGVRREGLTVRRREAVRGRRASRRPGPAQVHRRDQPRRAQEAGAQRARATSRSRSTSSRPSRALR